MIERTGDPRRIGAILARMRLVIYVGLFGFVGFGVWRYDIVRLPKEGCSPLAAFEPGDRLVIDLHPSAVNEGDAVLFQNPAGELLLGRVGSPPRSAPPETWAAIRAGKLWIVGERADCPQADSRRHGPIDPEQLAGRVASALPW